MSRLPSNSNGDGTKSVPKRSAPLDGQSPAHPDNQHEAQIIKALTGRYDEIEALWNKAEEDLKRFRLPNSVEHCYSSDYDHGYPEHYFLCWTRYGKSWRIVHEFRTAYSEVDDGRHDESEWKPIIECPLDLRIAMISEFSNLRNKVIEAAEKAVPALDEAISSFRKILQG